MARAGVVHGIKPKKSLRTNAARVIAVRLEEFLSWRGALEDATRITELHDMRIAAKRLRYALEIFEPCFDGARPVIKELTAIQDDLGEIHDLDVLEDVLRHRLTVLETPLEGRATEIMASTDAPGEKTKQLRRLLSAHAREVHRLGLLGLIGDKIAERRRRYGRFQERWGSVRLDEFAERVRALTRDEGMAQSEALVEVQPNTEKPGITIATIGS